jgi:CHAD domain-containing protein
VNTHPMSKVTCDVCGWTRWGYFGVAEAKCPMDSAPGKEIGELYVTCREAHRKYNEEVANCLGQIKDKHRAHNMSKEKLDAAFNEQNRANKEPNFEENLLKHWEVIERIVREMEVSASYDEAHFNRYTTQAQRILQLEASELYMANRHRDLISELKDIRSRFGMFNDAFGLDAIIKKYSA